MRVLTFLHSFGPGGVERDALRLLAALRADGVEVPVVMGRGDGAMDRPDLDYHVLDAGGRTAGFETLWMIWRLPEMIRRLRPDVLYCAGNTYSIVAVMMRLWLGRACPPIVIKISNDLRRQDMPWLVRVGYHAWVRWQLRLMAGIIAMAPAAVDEIVAVGRVARGRVTMIRNPCFTQGEMAEFAAAARTPGPGVRFLSVGRLAAQKNQALLIRAFADAAGPEDQLMIVGEGRLRGDLERLVARLGVAERVAMPGYCDAPAAAFAAADVFVLSSDYEGLGVVVVEALAAGLPIVATDCCVNMGELLGDGRFGTLVPVGDAAALAGAMRAAGDAVRDGVAVDRAGMRALAGLFTVEKAVAAQRRLFAQVADIDES
ncbi:glycosyltransferase [Polymorphobacter sp.]|uniref:glycosyltransferase n=1 Tax=Polymorphobacter sp. TaxID=1909290 RepID=UPI003F714DE3